MREFTHSLAIEAPPAAVLDAFFDPAALAAWWQATRSLCLARPLGSYAVEWNPTEWRDAALGRLGGAFRGTVMEFAGGREFFVADAYWLPPDGEPVGPMALEASCVAHASRTILHVRQSGGGDTPRWARYYEVLGTRFPLALDALKAHVERRHKQPAARPAPSVSPAP
jgi:uncharacterized protein YndB with AHSA1/START domain